MSSGPLTADLERVREGQVSARALAQVEPTLARREAAVRASIFHRLKAREPLSAEEAIQAWQALFEIAGLRTALEAAVKDGARAEKRISSL